MASERPRSVARFVRYLPDRVLHSLRRRSAARRLRRLSPPRGVLFICHGNICRSPYAAAWARLLLSAGTRVESAGFIGQGYLSPAEAVAAAGERGVDLAPHRSQQVTPELLDASDLVVVMDGAQRERILGARPALAGRTVLLGDLDPEPIARRAIYDPVFQSVEVFRATYARVERCTRVLCGLWDERGAGDAGR